MGTLNSLKQKLLSTRSKIIDIAGSSVLETQVDYLKIQANQLQGGKDKNGEAIKLDGSEVYADSTIKYKQRYGVGIGAITDKITLYNKGFLQDSLTLKVVDNDIFVDFSLYYGGFIVNRSTEIIFGLNEKGRPDYLRILTPVFIKNIKNELSGL